MNTRIISPLFRAMLLMATLTSAQFASAAFPGCSLTPTGGMVTVSLGYPDGEGAPRTYELYVPDSLASLDEGTPVPFLMSLHGLGGSGGNHGPKTGWIEFSETEPMVVVFPNGPRSWDNREDSIDVAYLRDLIEDVRSTYCIDDTRIHMTGHSNGSFMSQRMACDGYDLVASIAPYAGGRPDNGAQGGPCSPKRAVPVALFHGDNDSVVNISQGRATRDGWVLRHDCDTVPTLIETADGPEEIYNNCKDNAEVRWHVYPGQPHAWPEEPVRRDDLLARIWAFFERFPHPAPWNEGTTLPSGSPVLSQLEDYPGITTVTLLGPQPEEIATQVAVGGGSNTCENPTRSRKSLKSKKSQKKNRKLAPAVDTDITFNFQFDVEPNTVGASSIAVPGCDAPRPLANELVAISFGEGLPTHVLTDANGRASATLATPAQPGEAIIRARFDGDHIAEPCPARAASYKLTVFATP